MIRRGDYYEAAEEACGKAYRIAYRLSPYFFGNNSFTYVKPDLRHAAYLPARCDLSYIRLLLHPSLPNTPQMA